METAAFLGRAELLKEKLGPMLLQFPPSFTANHLLDLAEYLKQLPNITATSSKSAIKAG